MRNFEEQTDVKQDPTYLIKEAIVPFLFFFSFFFLITFAER